MFNSVWIFFLRTSLQSHASHFFHVFLIFSQVLITIGSLQGSIFSFLFSMNGRPFKFCRPPRLLSGLQHLAPCCSPGDDTLILWGSVLAVLPEELICPWRVISWLEGAETISANLHEGGFIIKKNVHNHRSSQSQLFKQFTESGAFPGLTKEEPLKNNVAHSSFQWIPRQSRKEARPLSDNGAH